MKNLNKKPIYLLPLMLLFLYSCNSEEDFFEIAQDESIENPVEHYISQLPQVVCDPLDEQEGTVEGGVNSNYGLQGDLFEGIGIIRSFSDMIDPVFKTPIEGQSKLMDAQINMSQLNVPTRAFDSGFKLGQDRYVEGSDGQILTEDFGMLLRTRFQLADLDEGYYEFALLSDDGSVLRVQSPSAEEGDYDLALAEMDFNTSTRLGCSDRIVRLNKEDRIPMEISYFQGPRYHIALMLLMRKVGDLDDGQAFTEVNPQRDEECGMSGNARYFNSNNGSTPQSAFNGLMDRGWFVPGSENYLLPSVADVNYCVEGTNITVDREQCFREDIKNFDVTNDQIEFLYSEVEQIDFSTLSVALGDEYLEEDKFTVSLEDEKIEFHVAPNGRQNIRLTYCLQE